MRFKELESITLVHFLEKMKTIPKSVIYMRSSRVIHSKLRRIFTRRNNQQTRRQIGTNLFRHETIFTFRTDNLGVIVVKGMSN